MPPNMAKKEDLNRALRDAIGDRDIREVRRLLESGADPNFELPKEDYNDCQAGYEWQPYSPLRLLIFCISDGLIGEKELAKDALVAALLLKYGADPKSAMELAERRYGKFNPKKEKKHLL